MTEKRNINSQQPLSDDALEALLKEAEFVEVPQYFTNKVMQRIDDLPNALTVESDTSNPESDIPSKPRAAHSKSDWWQWAALIGGGIPALMQVLAFIFSAWSVASLG